MKTVFYKITCLTNLHVGSGEINYNIIDNEVEKDAVSGLPVIHSSGVKGALRDAVKDVKDFDLDYVFGKDGNGDTGNAGAYKFLDACLISRPMRVAGSNQTASVSVVTVDSVNRLLRMLEAFGVNSFGFASVDEPCFGDNEFLTNVAEDIMVEGEKTGKLTGTVLTQLDELKAIIGSSFAVAKSFDGYDLPVIARNHVGKSGGLWYEEVVPHDSVLYFAVIYPDDESQAIPFPDVVQFGGNASVGCGYCKIEKI